MKPILTGIHHVTAVSADIRGNKAFYTEVLGLRLVKRTVNQDDTSAYHLFYADKAGSPGTDITFFDWPAAPAAPGNHSVSSTSFRILPESWDYWHARLRAYGTNPQEQSRGGLKTLAFEDPEGQRLALTLDEKPLRRSVPWEKSSVPEAQQLLGFGPVTLSVPKLAPTALILEKLMDMQLVGDYADPERAYADPERAANKVFRYAFASGGLDAEVHVAVRPEVPRARPGAGSVHHVAFRTPDDANYHAWAERLTRAQIPHSGEVDRYYFKSLYFREPGGILFEIATDGPGFAADEDSAHLGENVALPPFLEPQRAQIIANLKPLD